MSCSTIQLDDLPDEILIQIFNKLSNVEILFSIIGVNKRLDRLVRDRIFTQSLNLTIPPSYSKPCSMSDVMLNRFCSNILPEICDNIESIQLEPLSMEHILLACSYPQLNKLILHSIEPKVFLHYLADDSLIVHIFKQITHLEISTDEYYTDQLQLNLNLNAYERLFSVCNRLTHLKVDGRYLRESRWMRKYAPPLTMCSSSMIIELNVRVLTTDDCLRLLDGRFNQLKSLYVHIASIDNSSLHIDNKTVLQNLTTFSLVSCSPTEEYDNVIVPLLQQMPNLQKLLLCVFVENRSEFIDGTHLYNEILIYIPRLAIFWFDIVTIDSFAERIYWFINRGIENRHIIENENRNFHCYIDYFTNGIRRCRIYSFPFYGSAEINQ